MLCITFFISCYCCTKLIVYKFEIVHVIFFINKIVHAYFLFNIHNKYILMYFFIYIVVLGIDTKVLICMYMLKFFIQCICIIKYQINCICVIYEFHSVCSYVSNCLKIICLMYFLWVLFFNFIQINKTGFIFSLHMICVYV